MDICDSNSFSEKVNLRRLQVLHEDNPSVPIRGKTLQNLRPRWSTPSMRLFKLDGGWRRTGQSTYTSCFSFYYVTLAIYLNIFTYVTLSFYLYVTISFYLYVTISFYLYVTLAFYLNISFNLNIFTCVTQSISLYVTLSFYYYVTLTFYLNFTLSFYINQYLCYSSFLPK